jgi:hypothetical protein
MRSALAVGTEAEVAGARATLALRRRPTRARPEIIRAPAHLSTRRESRPASMIRCTCFSGTLVTDAASLAVRGSVRWGGMGSEKYFQNPGIIF